MALTTRIPGALIEDPYVAPKTTSQTGGRGSGRTTRLTRSRATTSAPAPRIAPPVSIAPVSRVGAAPAITAAPPAAAPAAQVPVPASLFDVDEIRAALDAISSVFDLQTGELSEQQLAARRAFDFLRDNLLGARAEAIELTAGEAAGRGLLRSGLYLGEVGRISSQTAEQTAQARSERDARLAAIARQTAGLAAQEEAERAVAARQLAKQQLATKEQLAQVLKLV